MVNKALSFIGICQKAGALVSGEYAVEKAVKEERAFLVVIAEDVSAGSTKKYTNMCTFYQVPLEVYGTKETLGRVLGKEYRASLAVTDEKMAAALGEKIRADKV